MKRGLGKMARVRNGYWWERPNRDGELRPPLTNGGDDIKAPHAEWPGAAPRQEPRSSRGNTIHRRSRVHGRTVSRPRRPRGRQHRQQRWQTTAGLVGPAAGNDAPEIYPPAEELPRLLRRSSLPAASRPALFWRSLAPSREGILRRTWRV